MKRTYLTLSRIWTSNLFYWRWNICICSKSCSSC